MSIRLEPKLPAEVRRYRHDWSAFLGADTIASETTSSTDVTVEDSEIDVGDQSITFVLSGGTAGTARITQEIVTAAGDEETETFILSIGVDEPVTLNEGKAQCRMVEDDSEDGFISMLLAPARAYVEKVSTHAFVAGERIFTFSRWGDYLELFLRPIVSVDDITYGPEGDETTYTGFVAPVGRYPLRIYPAGVSGAFPDLNDGEAITVTLTTGAVDPGSHEYLIGKRAMLLLIGHWFDNRETAVIGAASAEVDFAVRELLSTIRPVSAY